MGSVWLAYDVKLRVEVALKAVRTERLGKRGLELLRQEVRSAREVSAPQVCRIFDLVEADGEEFVSMEYVDGVTLRERLDTESPLDLDTARELATQLLSGLSAIHHAGLIHRDLNPDNVMITRSGRVVIMDFGIARAATGGSRGTVAGTGPYMAPEQIRGESVDARADVYAAGVVLSEMIAPSGVRTPDERKKLWEGLHANPPTVPKSPWSRLLSRALAEDREARPRSARELLHELEEVALRVTGAEERNPYPGLAAFTPDDATHFFGREAEIEAVWKKLQQLHLLALVGPSGAGKSSFLQAGLLPTTPDGWRSVRLSPGSAPFLALGRALVPELAHDVEAIRKLLHVDDIQVALESVVSWREKHEEVLLVVDQFEELFTLNSPDVQASFAEFLGRSILDADAHVLVAIRDDFLLRCHEHPSLAPLFKELTPLGPLTGDALRRALVQPALTYGYKFEDEALVEEILADVSREKGALPLLAFAAARLWELRDKERGHLTREAHREIGGVSGALAQHAERTLEGIGSPRRPVVREIFRNLATAQGTRATRDVDELLSVFGDPGDERHDAARDALEALVDARLLTTYESPSSDEETNGTAASRRSVEIIQESLLTRWPRLLRWRTQDAEGAQLRDELRRAAELWEARDRPDDLLWTDTLFREFQIWRARYQGGLSQSEEAFAAAMEQRTARLRRRQRLTFASIVAFLMLVSAVTGILWLRSEAAREEAVVSAREAEASQLLALGRLELASNPTGAVAYALASLELADDPAVRQFALEALWQGPTATHIPASGSSRTIQFSPDGKWLAEGGSNGSLLLWSTDGGEPAIVGQHGGAIESLQFSPDSTRLLSQGVDNKVNIVSMDEHRVVRVLEFDGPVVFQLTTDGEQVVTASRSREQAGTSSTPWVIETWNLRGGEHSISGHLVAHRITISPDAESLVYTKDDRKTIFSVPTRDPGRPPVIVGEHKARVDTVVFDRDGSRIAAADRLSEIRIWPLSSSRGSEPTHILRGHVNQVRRMRFSPDGDHLAAAVRDEDVHLWRLRGPPEATPMVLRRGVVAATFDVTFHPTGKWVATAYRLGISLWPLVREYPHVLGPKGTGIFGVTVAPESDWLATSGTDGAIRKWALTPEAKAESEVLFRASGSLTRIEMDPGERYLVAGSEDGPVHLVPLDGSAPRTMRGFSSRIVAVAISSDAKLIAAAGGRLLPRDGVIRILDIESDTSRVLDPGPGQWIASLGFTPEGKIASAGSNRALLWDLEERSQQVIRESAEGENAVFALTLSPDGRLAVTGTSRFPYLRRTGNPSQGPPKLAPTATGYPIMVHNLEDQSSHAIDSHGGQTTAATFNEDGTLLASGDSTGLIRVGPVSGDTPHLLAGHQKIVRALRISSSRNQVFSSSRDGVVRIWPIPTGEPFHVLPYDEFLERLGRLTNLRAVEDPNSASGYKLATGAFAGWSDAPSW